MISNNPNRILCIKNWLRSFFNVCILKKPAAVRLFTLLFYCSCLQCTHYKIMGLIPAPTNANLLNRDVKKLIS